MQATSSNLQLLDLWRVDRPGEGQAFEAHAHLGNRRLLWHGTHVAKVAAILKAGLRIMPHAGGRVGRGLYLVSAGLTWGATVVLLHASCLMAHTMLTRRLQLPLLPSSMKHPSAL